MKYRNAKDVLPADLLEQVQKYVQGEYLYIPIRDRYKVESVTDYKTELEKRDRHIYTQYLEGMDQKRLSRIYNLSESSIRRIVMKQRKDYQVTCDKISGILYHWGLENCERKQIYDTAWQIGSGYVLKVYRNPVLLERNLNILAVLEEMKIPVGGIVLTIDQNRYVSVDGNYFFLSKKLSGSNLVRITNTRNLALRMGEIIGDLHGALKKCEDTMEFWDNRLLDEMNGWVKQTLENGNWRYISKDDYEQTVSQLAVIFDELPVQLIHRDIHFGNFLFEHEKFSGYIDFDLSQKNIRIFDLCYFLLGLLSEKEKYEISKEQWFDFITGIFTGYEKRQELTETEKKSVPYVMECIELLFVSYFDRIGDRHCAEHAYGLYEFVRRQEKRIWKSV